ncbi:hypothetical protein GLOIN_2v1788374 [Rhizophagus irregularis DAOM 181602=DAOM 197198]|uniref:Uncharacterized protein n=1 Tax=Rhizophagus irregularis (strain DAOM 181602 / DAOM 197198 / MUCL 43194) TaxID=747089 RepID=U9SYV4_RHIID|nr:hypothetical protein GLOIN_2v1788374 [Rhizophagus irregularis DAOM 181602=DAOM 197198]
MSEKVDLQISKNLILIILIESDSNTIESNKDTDISNEEEDSIAIFSRKAHTLDILCIVIVVKKYFQKLFIIRRRHIVYCNCKEVLSKAHAEDILCIVIVKKYFQKLLRLVIQKKNSVIFRRTLQILLNQDLIGTVETAIKKENRL